MEEKILFERFLYEDGNPFTIGDIEFCIDRIVILPKIRPHYLEKVEELSVELCKNVDFRGRLLAKSNDCPVLIFRLYKRGVLLFEEIEPFLRNTKAFLLSYYFRKKIDDFENFVHSKHKPHGLDESFFGNGNNIDQLIEYGYLPSSIEFFLKYDVIDDLVVIDNLCKEARWSPFEWSFKPKYLDLLSFSGFFGSIKCFKLLLMKGFDINDKVLSMVVCGGCFDLFHLCQGKQFVTPKLACQASEFFHLPLLVFMIENGTVMNAKGNDEKNPLHYAAQNGHLSIVEYLVKQNFDINSKDENKWTPLHCAASDGHLSVVEYLVNQKADINGINDNV